MTTIRNGSFRLMVADDDAACRDALVEFFLREGYSVCTASDGAQAIELILRERVDFSVMDVHMPGLTGVEVLRQLTETSGPRVVPPTVLTSSDPGAADLARQLQGIPVDFVPKPIRLDALRRSVQHLLNTSRAPQP